MTTQISKEDVIQVADDLNIELSDEQIQSILNEYDDYSKMYPNENWSYIVELMIDGLPGE